MNPPPTSRPPRSSWQLVQDRDFGIAFWAKSVLVTGVWAQTMVFVVLTYRLTGSATWVGVVGAAQLVPQVTLALASGALADRYGPARPIILGGIISGLGCAIMAAWLTTGWHAGTSVALTGTSLTCGVGMALFAPALQAIVPMLVRVDEVSTAAALNFVPTTLARTVGPAFGALLMSAVSARESLIIVGTVFVASAATFNLVHMPPLDPSPSHGGRPVPVLRYVRSDIGLLTMFGAVAALGAGSEVAITLAPVLGHRLGGTSAPGWITSAFGLGGVAGVLAHGFLRRRMSPTVEGCLAMVILGAAMGIAGGSVLPSTTLFALMLSGAASVLGITAFSVAIQARSPHAILGRLMGLWVVAFCGARPVAALALGATAEQFSMTAALLGAAALLVAASCAVFITLKRCDAGMSRSDCSSTDSSATVRPVA